MKLEIFVCDTRPAVASALEKALASFPQVHVRCGDVKDFDQTGVCFVNPVSVSDGWTQGSLDATLAHLGNSAVQTVPLRGALLDTWEGGRFCITFAYCAVRKAVQPGDVYLGTRVLLSMAVDAVRRGVGVHTLVMTGVGTGRGVSNRDRVVKEIKAAFQTVLVDKNLVIDPHQARHPDLLQDPVHGFSL